MSVLVCESCGEITQTVVCNLQLKTELSMGVEQYMVATECYARMMEGSRIWTKGCAYDHCDSFAKTQADKLIEGLSETGRC